MSYSFGDADRDGCSAAEDAFETVTRNVRAVARQAAADPLLAGAVASMGLALGLQLTGHSRAARFVGLWAPTLLLLGMYRRSTTDEGDVSRRHTAALDLERRFEGGCAAPPADWEETIDDDHRMTAARDADDYSDRFVRVAPHKAK